MESHPEYWVQIDALADGALGGAEREHLEAHLSWCADCSRRLAGARREASLLQAAFAPAEPPPELARAVMARVAREEPRAALAEMRPAPIERAARRPARSLWRAVGAGIAGNLLTAGVLLVLSLGAGASLALMLLVASVGAVVSGGLKGLAFGWGLRFLPGGVLGRGLAFGVVVWAITNLLLAFTGGVGPAAGYSPAFVLLGSLAHHAIYGAILSWLYARFSAPSTVAPA